MSSQQSKHNDYREDQHLVERCISGNSKAWSELVERAEPNIKFTIIHTMKRYQARFSSDQVEDMTCDILLALVIDDFAKLRRYHGKCRFSHWLKVVTNHYTVDQLRKRRKIISLDDEEKPLPLNFTLLDQNPSPVQNCEHKEGMEKLRKLYDNLSGADRLFAELYYREERGFEEIAQIMTTTIGAVYARKNRVRKKLLHFAEKQRIVS